MPRDCLRIIECKSKVRNSRNKLVVTKVSTSNSTPGISPDVSELKDMVKALLLDKKNQSQALATVKAVEENYVTCGEYVSQAAAAISIKEIWLQSPIANQILTSWFSSVQSNPSLPSPPYQASGLANIEGSGTLPSNTVTNPKVNLKGITTRSSVAYQGPTIPTTSSSPPKVVERETKVTKDMVPPANNRSTRDVQPMVIQIQPQGPNSEPVVAPVSAPKPNPKPSIPYPSRLNDKMMR
ncbi:hypothetical protein Tco_0800821 [Tanacetum coccineum]|uniref:Reverse transcriptase domain-containing protein n=1 Tax=Tanacetum coccineum TaxID=301880 RepID=A0ABQ4ZUD1_9ASTR